MLFCMYYSPYLEVLVAGFSPQAIIRDMVVLREEDNENMQMGYVG